MLAHLLLELVELFQIVDAQPLLEIVDDSLEASQFLVQMRDPRGLPYLKGNLIN